MGELLGLGLSHFPMLCGPDEMLAGLLRWTLDDPALPDDLRSPGGWPAEMQAEWGSDDGLTAAASHRAALVDGFRRVRRTLDEFEPDAVVIVGDDQYENFREDVVPALTVHAYDDRTVRPWHPGEGSNGPMDSVNVWGERPDTELLVRGRPDIGRGLATNLLQQEIDVAYAYEPLHHRGLPHAFLNAILFLDYDREGFDHPIVALSVNCYGRRTVSYRGTISRLDDERPLDPPSPTPRRMMAVGAAIARAVERSPWRIALVASSSWSHAFLCDKTWRLRPDTPADLALYDALVRADYASWRAVELAELEESGQQEVLNWFALVGAMDELSRPPTWTTLVETQIFNSNKVFATFTEEDSA